MTTQDPPNFQVAQSCSRINLSELLGKDKVFISTSEAMSYAQVR